MKPGATAIVGTAESTLIGVASSQSQLALHADAALNAVADAGLTLRDIDGYATSREYPSDVAFYLGISPAWVDGTSVGGCSFMMHVRHAAAAIAAGLCSTVLITHGESGRSRIGWFHEWNPAGLTGQFDLPFGMSTPACQFGLPLLRYMKEFGLGEEQLAQVAVVQRQWAARNPRAAYREPITIEDVLRSPMIAYPLRRLMCCLASDGGGALILTSAERARDFPHRPVYVLGAGEATDVYMTGIAHVADPIRPEVIRRCGQRAFAEAGITHADVDHLMIYDAFAHTPIFGLEGLGFTEYGEAGQFIWEGNTAVGGPLPMNTNGGGLSYMHSGEYGLHAILESVRQLRGTAPAQVPDCTISVAHGFGGFFSACGTLVLGNERG